VPVRRSSSSYLRAQQRSPPRQQRTPLRVEIPKTRYSTRIIGPIDYNAPTAAGSIGFTWLPDTGFYGSDESDRTTQHHVNEALRPAGGTVAINVARLEGAMGGMS